MGCAGNLGQTVMFGKLLKIQTRKMIIKFVFRGQDLRYITGDREQRRWVPKLECGSYPGHRDKELGSRTKFV